jgi:hypothetical protein
MIGREKSFTFSNVTSIITKDKGFFPGFEFFRRRFFRLAG